ncbi:MAG: hypothetical protein HYX78_02360 [Armatimonadetes bacterium]|nr:hypothetical protein [Armatimonadota bacterium]
MSWTREQTDVRRTCAGGGISPAIMYQLSAIRKKKAPWWKNPLGAFFVMV